MEGSLVIWDMNTLSEYMDLAPPLPKETTPEPTDSIEALLPSESNLYKQSTSSGTEDNVGIKNNVS